MSVLFALAGNHVEEQRLQLFGDRAAAASTDGSVIEFDAVVRIDTPGEADYYRNGGILQYVLRSLV